MFLPKDNDGPSLKRTYHKESNDEPVEASKICIFYNTYTPKDPPTIYSSETKSNDL